MTRLAIAKAAAFAILPSLALAQPSFPAGIEVSPEWQKGQGTVQRPVRPPGGREIWVDGSSGDDANNGDASSPLRTIGKAIELAGAGDTVTVRAGTYNEQIVIPDKNPAPSLSAPLVIRADPAGGQVVLDGTGVVLATEGTLDNPAGVSIYRDGAVVLEGFTITNYSGYGVAVQQSSFATVKGCTFRANGAGMADPVDLLVISSQGARVLGNTFEGTASSERAIDDRSTDTEIAFNDFTGYPSSCIKVGPAPAGSGCRIEHNLFTGNPASEGVILLDRARTVVVTRNILDGGSLQGIRLEQSTDCQVLLNTVTGFQFGLELHFAERCRIAGNIFYSNTVGIEFLSAAGTSQPDGNLYFSNTADTDGGSAGPGAVFADPLFTDPAGGDFTPATGSPAIDAGPDDLPVPEGGGGRVDIGAVEAGAGRPPWHYQPLGRVEDLTPRLSWIYDEPGGGQQGAFRVQLDTSPGFDSPDLRDSGYVTSASSEWIVPDAADLAPGRWYVRVQTRSASNQPGPWSNPQIAFELVEPQACASQGGTACNPLDGCSGQWLVASDTDRCCRGDCIACPDSDSDGHLDSACGGDDCDDSDAAVHPDASEVCDNSTDDDCDGMTDLGDSDCGCIDHDRDGYGENCTAGPDCDDSIASVHPGAEELCNNTDDDCDGSTDEGFDLQADPDNCGECGWRCREALGEVCDLGQCKAECGPGRTDCDRWCIDTTTDPENCGGCGVKCALDHADSTCTGGQCILTACEQGWVDLDGDALNGCEYSCTPAPGGIEACGNGTDDDCDGLTDEDCSGGCSCSQARGGIAGGTVPLALLALLVILRGGLLRPWQRIRHPS